MALTTAEEALIRQLIAQNAALLNLASSESSIISKLGATKVTLDDLLSATAVDAANLLLMRQGTTDKSVTPELLREFVLDGLAAVNSSYDNSGSGLDAEDVQGAIDEIVDEKYTDADALAWFESYGKSLAINGYQKLPSGLIIQWGSFDTGSIGNTTTGTQAFPVSFPHSCFQVIVGSTHGTINGGPQTEGFNAGGVSATSFDWVSHWEYTRSTIRYLAIGY